MAVPLGMIVPIVLIALGLGVTISAALGEDSGAIGVATAGRAGRGAAHVAVTVAAIRS